MEVIEIAPKSFGGGNKKPTIIPWKDTKMIRNHSINAVVRDIKNSSVHQDLISINVIGKQSTGKTELCKTLAHQVHKLIQEENGLNYNVLHIGRHELLNLEETVANLKPTNHIIIFDDIAFLKASASSKDVDKIQSVLAEIRHLPGGKDVRIIIFKSFQYTKALPPFLRQNDMTFVSSVDDNELENLIKMLGAKSQSQIHLLKRLQNEVKLHGKFRIFLGKRGAGKFDYIAKKPFLPYLYFDGNRGRIIVSPLWTWIDPTCPTCDDINEVVDKDFNLEQFIKDFSTKFGDSNNAKQIVKIKLMVNGVNCYPKKIAQGLIYIEQFLSKRLVSLDDLRKAYDLEETKTHLSKVKQPEIKDE